MKSLYIDCEGEGGSNCSCKGTSRLSRQGIIVAPSRFECRKLELSFQATQESWEDVELARSEASPPAIYPHKRSLLKKGIRAQGKAEEPSDKPSQDRSRSDIGPHVGSVGKMPSPMFYFYLHTFSIPLRLPSHPNKLSLGSCWLVRKSLACMLQLCWSKCIS